MSSNAFAQLVRDENEREDQIDMERAERAKDRADAAFFALAEKVAQAQAAYYGLPKGNDARSIADEAMALSRLSTLRCLLSDEANKRTKAERA